MVGTKIAAEALGEVAHHATGHVGKVAGMIAVPIINSMRQAGFDRADHLLAEALFKDPELFRRLLAKAPQNKVAANVLRNRILALSAGAATSNASRTIH
jgi:hypothetical protein